VLRPDAVAGVVERRRDDITGGVDRAVGGDQGDAEQFRIDLGERRNVVGVLAFVERSDLSVSRVNRSLDLGWRLRARRCRRREHPQAEDARANKEIPNPSTHFPSSTSPRWLGALDDRSPLTLLSMW